MEYQTRLIEKTINEILSANKSILLFGARQTGKTTLFQHIISADFSYNLLDPNIRLKLEADPNILARECEAFTEDNNKIPLVLIDEIQTVPELFNVIQLLIDSKKGLFVLTGSSARKIKLQKNINLLPGRLIQLFLDGLMIDELNDKDKNINDLLCYGMLPEIVLGKTLQEQLLQSYVNLYLDIEIRKEASVKKISSFIHFLEYAAMEAGHSINISKLSQQIGESMKTINEYYQILEDSMIAYRIEALTQTNTRRRLQKAPKYLMFDIGIRRIAAKDGTQLSNKTLGQYFEQFIGMEILKLIHLNYHNCQLLYWRDHAGPEVDFIIKHSNGYTPVEVKWTDRPTEKDARHLKKFMNEFSSEKGYIVCRVDKPQKITENILAISWKELSKAFLES